MKPITTLIAAVLLAVAASALVSGFSSGDTETRADDPVAPSLSGAEEVVLRLEQALERIEMRQAALEARLGQGPSAAGAARAPAAPTDEAIDRAVARWMAENGGGATPAETATAAEDRELAALDTDALLDLLMAEGSWGAQELWQRVRDAGRMDEVLAELESMCEAHPTNPELRVQLADAYIQKIFDVGNGPLAGVFGTKADQAYDEALELDPSHWQARFNKAVALSNWPAFLGKSGEAIRQFEILIDQQGTLPSHASHAQTYLILGNMYQRSGEAEKAMKAWQDGLALFPDDEALREQVLLSED